MITHLHNSINPLTPIKLFPKINFTNLLNPILKACWTFLWLNVLYVKQLYDISIISIFGQLTPSEANIFALITSPKLLSEKLITNKFFLE